MYSQNKTLERVKELGYDGCEFAGTYGKTPEEIREKCLQLELVRYYEYF